MGRGARRADLKQLLSIAFVVFVNVRYTNEQMVKLTGPGGKKEHIRTLPAPPIPCEILLSMTIGSVPPVIYLL